MPRRRLRPRRSPRPSRRAPSPRSCCCCCCGGDCCRCGGGCCCCCGCAYAAATASPNTSAASRTASHAPAAKSSPAPAAAAPTAGAVPLFCPEASIGGSSPGPVMRCTLAGGRSHDARSRLPRPLDPAELALKVVTGEVVTAKVVPARAASWRPRGSCVDVGSRDDVATDAVADRASTCFPASRLAQPTFATAEFVTAKGGPAPNISGRSRGPRAEAGSRSDVLTDAACAPICAPASRLAQLPLATADVV